MELIFSMITSIAKITFANITIATNITIDFKIILQWKRSYHHIYCELGLVKWVN